MMHNPLREVCAVSLLPPVQGTPVPPGLDHLGMGEVFSCDFFRSPVELLARGLKLMTWFPGPPPRLRSLVSLVACSPCDLLFGHDTMRLSRTPGEPAGCYPSCSPAPRTPAFRAWCRDSGYYPPVRPPPSTMEREAGVSRREPWRLVLVLATLLVGGGRWGGPRSGRGGWRDRHVSRFVG